MTTTAAQYGAEACVLQGCVEDSGQAARVMENRVQMRGLVEDGKATCKYQGDWPHHSLLPKELESAHQLLCSEGGGEGGGGRRVEVGVGVSR